MLGMNFFTRKVKNAVIQFENIFLEVKKNSTSTKDLKPLIFSLLESAEYREIDESLFFMFRIYQATQTRIFSSLNTVIQDMNSNNVLLIIF
jgi:hypothetical protein